MSCSIFGISPISSGTYNNFVVNVSGQIVSASNISYSTGSPTITVTGDVSGSGSNSLNLSLATVGTIGTYSIVQTDSKGRVVSGQSLTASGDVSGTVSGSNIVLTLQNVVTPGTFVVGVYNAKGLFVAGQNLVFAGDFTGTTSNNTVTATLAAFGTAGTFTKVITDAKGRVASGGFLAASDVTAALGFTPISANQSITFSGDVSGSGNTAVALTLAASGVTAGTYTKHVVNSKGLVTQGLSLNQNDIITALGFTPTTPIVSTPGTFNTLVLNNAGQITGGSNTTYLQANQLITFTGDATGSGTTAVTLTLASSGVTPGTYIKNVVNAKGLITGGSALLQSDIISALGFTPSTPVVSSSGTFNNVQVNSAGQVISAFNQPYLTGNQTITVSGDVSGSGQTSLNLVLNASGVTAGTYIKTVVNAKGLVTQGLPLTSTDINSAVGYTVLASQAVTTSTSNVVTDKIQVVVGGITYYLLASTSAT